MPMHDPNCKHKATYITSDKEIGYCTIGGKLLIRECQTCVGCNTHTNIIEKLMED